MASRGMPCTALINNTKKRLHQVLSISIIYKFENEQQLTYVWFRISTDNNITNKIRALVLAANNPILALTNISNVSRQTKLGLTYI